METNQRTADMATVLDPNITHPDNAAADSSFEPYGRLLRMLMPSLRGVVVHDGFSVRASVIWTFASAISISCSRCPRSNRGRATLTNFR